MINDILEARERRYNLILDIINIYTKPVICGKINYPGNNKNTIEAQKSFEILKKLLLSNFDKDSLYNKNISGADGSAILIATKLDVVEAKQLAIDLENKHPLGRIFDIDIYDLDGTSIGREKMNIHSRGCLICSEDARICMRSGKHTLEEVIDSVNSLINGYLTSNSPDLSSQK